jgi:(p)ppGpp synthase/HD superfamily hydrolase
MILDNFSWRIAQMVDMLTRDRPDGSKLTVEEILNNSYQKKDREVLLIKLFDRLHNIQTLSSHSLEKITKTAEETINFFIVTTMYTGYTNLGQTIYKLCCENLSIDYLFDNDLEFSESKSYLDFLETSHSHQIVSQVFQNVINPLKNKE